MKNGTTEDVITLKQEITELKNNNSIAIASFEKNLLDLKLHLPEDIDPTLSFDSIDIFTMEEPPSLTESIRKIPL